LSPFTSVLGPYKPRSNGCGVGGSIEGQSWRVIPSLPFLLIHCQPHDLLSVLHLLSTSSKASQRRLPPSHPTPRELTVFEYPVTVLDGLLLCLITKQIPQLVRPDDNRSSKPKAATSCYHQPRSV